MFFLQKIALFFGIAVSFSHASTVTYLGSDQTTNANWRTTTVSKPLNFDLNGDRIYGTAGYFVAKSAAGTNLGVDSNLPSFVSSVSYTASSTYNDSTHPNWDDPTLLPSATVTDRRYGIFFNSTTPIHFTLASAKRFVLMIPLGGSLTDNYPTTLAVTQTVGGSASASAATPLPTLAAPAKISYLFFLIEGFAGDRFQINLTGATSGNLAVGGLAWEATDGLVNRWSFNAPAGNASAGTAFTDSISGATAVVVGAGATTSGTALTLPGSSAQGQANGNVAASTIAAYVDLPNGIISSKTNLTLEFWARSITPQNQTRLFDFGRTNLTGVGAGAAPGEIVNNSTVAPGSSSASDDICFIPNIGTSVNNQQIEAKLNGAGTISQGTNLATTTGTEYLYTFVFEDGVGASGSTGGRFSWYRNGVLATSIDTNFRLRDIEDVNNWLGRSMWTGDANANISYNELRIYNRAFSPAEVTTSYTAGANANLAAPSTMADAATINPMQKVLINVLSNDTGNILPVTVSIQTPPAFGTATPDGKGNIIYAHNSGTPVSDSFQYSVSGLGGLSTPTTVNINFTNQLRIPNQSLNVPNTPPPTTYQIVDAFGSLAFSDPVCLATPPGETNRLFVCQKGGLLRVISDISANTPTATTFLNLQTLLASRGEAILTESESGLLGLAFHPNYATNRFFYIFYSVTIGGNAYQRVSRFTTQAGNTNLADSASELILLEQRDQAGNHNGGDLHFGPDGYLYISLGDEGGQNDGYQNSQRITRDFFSAIMRIDVDKKPGNLEPNAHPNPAQSDPAVNAIKRYGNPALAAYSIPIDNPFVTTAAGGTWNGIFNGSAISATNLPYVRSEFWTVGMRNPWRMSFDPPTGELWVGDVGGAEREEVNIITKGGNYGWSFREGFIAGPGTATAGFTSINPIYDYRHTGDTATPANFRGNSITGGFVYRGNRISNLIGAYIFADYVSGNIWSLQRNGANPPTVERITGEGSITAFGKDPSNGDVLMANQSSGRIRRLVAETPVNSYPLLLSETGLFADLTDLSPNPGLIPYKVNLPFWSDYAVKSRFFTIPDSSAKMTWTREGPWTYPTGQIWVKHFDMPLIRSNPPQLGDPLTPSKRVETRLLVKTATGSYGVSYRWNSAGTEATLSPQEGENFGINITRNGTSYTQQWRIPSRAECSSCHTPQGGHSLSMNTRQFNLNNIIRGTSGNQLNLLQDAGYFSNTVESTNLLPKHLAPDDITQTVEARVRSYLDVNCAYCHQPGGTGNPAVWDGRSQTPFDLMGLINGAAVNNGGDPLNKLVVPGDTLHSVVYNRVAVANGFTRMPPLGSSELDLRNISLLAEWINGPLATRQNYAAWRLAKFSSPSSAAGASSFDADGDNATNYAEYLAGTDPLSGSSFPQLTFSQAGNQSTLQFSTFPNRIMQIQASQDLTNWSLWDVPGNGEIPRNGNPASVSGNTLSDRSFFRLQMKEN